MERVSGKIHIHSAAGGHQFRAFPFSCICLAAQWLPAGYSATLNATAPMMGVLIGALCFAEPLTLRKGGGAILGAIGVAVIARPTSGLSAALLLPGIGACLTATRLLRSGRLS